MDDVRGDFLQPPHGTTPAAVIAKSLITIFQQFFISTKCNHSIY